MAQASPVCAMPRRTRGAIAECVLRAVRSERTERCPARYSDGTMGRGVEAQPYSESGGEYVSWRCHVSQRWAV